MYAAVWDMLEKRRDAPLADRAVVVGLVSWILMVAMLFFLGTRMVMKQIVRKKERLFGLDDVFIVAAALFSIGQTAAVSIESRYALGQHVSDLDSKQKRVFQTSEYASCILYIANMGCARISVCLLIKEFLPGRPPRIAAWAFAIFSAIWTVVGVLVAAFPCSLPDPWNVVEHKCIKLVSFVNYIGITNIVVEVLLVAIPLFVWNLRLSAGRSITVSLLFMARLSIVAAVAAQLSVFNHYSASLDYTYDYWRTVLCIQIAQNLSIISACLPCLCPFILNILSGKTKLVPITKECKPSKPVCRQLGRYMKGWCPETFDPMSSNSSQLPIKEETDEEYCRPLATYGLDKSSAHLQTQQVNGTPTKKVATPIRDPKPPEDIFMRRVSTPMSMRTDSVRRPGTSHSHSKELPPVPKPPKSLSQVGVLPIIDWDTDSNPSTQGSGSLDRTDIFSDSGRSDSPSSMRKRDSEYVFNRSKVISVPEDNAFFEQEYWKKYPPPPLSPPVLRDGKEITFPR